MLTVFFTFMPPAPSWTILINKAYVIKWTFGKPPPLPCLHAAPEVILSHRNLTKSNNFYSMQNREYQQNDLL